MDATAHPVDTTGMNTNTKTVIYPTRYPLLGYTHDAAGVWRFVAMQYRKADGEYPRIGPIHPNKVSLLADLDRFAAVYGY